MRQSDGFIAVERLEKHYIRKSLWKREAVKAVNGVSFAVRKGATLGLVGESGCGKSTTGQIIAGLIPSTSGRIMFQGREISWTKGSSSETRERHKQIQYVFQDPYASLNPRHRIATLLEEPLRIHRLGSREERRDQVLEMLERVGLGREYGSRYPHELSGGQRQRIGIARSLMLQPEFLILDEPVSALDVSVQAQILNLLRSLQEELELTYLFISHDLHVVHYISDYVAVMFAGRIVELAEASELFRNPLHPYARTLLEAIPDPYRRSRAVRAQPVQELAVLPPAAGGCPFHTRCVHAEERCRAAVPDLKDAGGGHTVSCHLYE